MKVKKVEEEEEVDEEDEEDGKKEVDEGDEEDGYKLKEKKKFLLHVINSTYARIDTDDVLTKAAGSEIPYHTLIDSTCNLLRIRRLQPQQATFPRVRYELANVLWCQHITDHSSKLMSASQ